MSDQTVEGDIRAMAQALRPKVVNGPDRGNVSVIPTASIVAKRLESLITKAVELHKRAEVLTTALAGPGGPSAMVNDAAKAQDHLFGRQMAGLDELGVVLDSIGRQIERAQHSLA